MKKRTSPRSLLSLLMAIGVASEYALPSAATQKLQSKLEVAYMRNGEELEHSNFVELIHRASTLSSRSAAGLPIGTPPADGGGGGGIPDAPVNGKLYGRKNAGWAEVPVGRDGNPQKFAP